MIDAVKNFITKRLFSEGYVFFGLLIAALLVFIVPGCTNVMGKLGLVETKVSLKGDLVAAQKDRDTAVQANKDLVRSAAVQQQHHALDVKAVQTNSQVKQVQAQRVRAIEKRRDDNARHAEVVLSQSTQTSEDSWVMDRAAADHVSQENIRSLHATFEQLFEAEQPPSLNPSSSS